MDTQHNTLVQDQITNVQVHVVAAVIASNASITGLRGLSISFRLCGYAFKKKKEALNVLTMTKSENKTSSSQQEVDKRRFRCKKCKL